MSVVPLPGGGWMILCSRGQVKTWCVHCHRPAPLLCDGPPRRASATTCDRPICSGCATKISDDRHLCLDCRRGSGMDFGW